MTFNLKKIRELNHVSQSKLAEAIHVSQQSISKYELGEDEPSYETLVLIADYFNVPFDYLLGSINLGEVERQQRYSLSKAEADIIFSLRTLDDRDVSIIKALIHCLVEESK